MEKEINKSKDEVTLIDLFAVVLKFRKLILIGTAVMFVVLAGALIGFTKLKDAKNEHPVTVLFTLEVKDFPADFYESKHDLNRVEELTRNYLHDTYLFAKLHENHPAFTDPYASDYFDKIDQILNTSKYFQINFHPVSNVFYLYCTVPQARLDQARPFLEEYVAYIQKTLVSDLRARSIVPADELEAWLSTAEPFVSLSPYTFDRKPASKTITLKIVILFLGSLFCFVFLAFVLNAVQSVKKDEEACKTLKDAWESGK